MAQKDAQEINEALEDTWRSVLLYSPVDYWMNSDVVFSSK
jgi:hypothetical protein